MSPEGDRLGIKVSTTLNWLVPDLHGDVAGSWDSTEATVVNAIRYDAWGGSLATGSAGGTAVGTGLWKFQGRLDVSPAGLSTPLYDMSARFYSPGIGAFTQLDSVMGSAQDPLSMNRFLYAEANPATLIDPSGHMAMCATSDSCDETMAIRYRHTIAGRQAAHRISRRDHGRDRDSGRGVDWIRRKNTGRGSGDAPQHTRRDTTTRASSGAQSPIDIGPVARPGGQPGGGPQCPSVGAPTVGIGGGGLISQSSCWGGGGGGNLPAPIGGGCQQLADCGSPGIGETTDSCGPNGASASCPFEPPGPTTTDPCGGGDVAASCAGYELPWISASKAKKGGENRPPTQPIPAPEALPGFPDARPAKPMTPYPGGKRDRWKDSKGRILEWDYLHGMVEMFDKTGKRHLGEFDPVTGVKVKPADPTKKAVT